MIAEAPPAAGATTPPLLLLTPDHQNGWSRSDCDPAVFPYSLVVLYLQNVVITR